MNLDRRPGQTDRLSDTPGLAVATLALLFIGPPILLPEDGWIPGAIATLPAVALLWLAVALWRRFNLPWL